MKAWFRLFFALVGFNLGSAIAAPLVMGYVSNWTLDQNPVLDSPGIVNATHVVYSFLKISPAGRCVEPDGVRYLRAFQKLKLRSPQTRILLSIGGWGGSQYFSSAAASSLSRQRLVQSCLQFLTRYDFDGVDLDWEFPVKGGLPENQVSLDDSRNQVLLVRELKLQMKTIAQRTHRSDPYLIGVAVSGEKAQAQVFDVPGLAREVDWFGVMAYDLCHEMGCRHSALQAYDGAHSFSEETIHDLIHRGARPEQLVFGLPFYGYLWNLKLGRSQTPQIVPIRDRASIRVDPAKEFLDLDSVESLSEKARFARAQGLGGVLIWDLPSDDRQMSVLRRIRNEIDQFTYRSGLNP